MAAVDLPPPPPAARSQSAPLEPVRVPRHDRAAESAVLASVLLIGATALDEVREVIDASDFYSDANRRIYQAALDVDAEQRPIDLVTVAGRLREDGRLEQVGDTPYLAQLVDATPAVHNVAAHADLVAACAQVRAVVRACETTAAEGYGAIDDVGTWLDERAGAVLAAAERAERVVTVGSYRELAASTNTRTLELARNPERLLGCPTGLARLDEHTAGMCPGDLWIIGARPGQGKTTLAQQALESAAKHGAAGVMFSMEMPRELLAQRSLARFARVPFSGLRRGRLRGDEWPAVANAVAAMARLPILVDDAPALSPQRLRSRLRRHAQRIARDPAMDGAGVAVVVVDYVQLMTGDYRTNNRNEEVSQITRSLKLLAREFQVCVIALSQLSRPPKGARVPRPTMFDLRDSGAIEADADNILMIHRDDEYLDDRTKWTGEAELILTKGRNCGSADLTVQFEAKWTAFHDAQGELPVGDPDEPGEYHNGDYEQEELGYAG